MSLKKLSLSILISFLCSFLVSSQELIKINPKDTISYNQANTEKVIAFGGFIDSVIINNKPEQFISKLFKNAFLKRVFDLKSLELYEEKGKKEFAEGMYKGLNTFPNEIIEEVQNGSSYDFISYRYDEIQQTYYAMFRFYSSEDGLNYHDFRLLKKDGDINFSDIYIYITGENLTKTLGRVMTYSLPKKKILGLIDNSKNKGFDKLVKVVRLKNSGNFKAAYNVIKSIKSEISNEKFFQIFKSLIASNVDEDSYLAALEELIKTHENDPTIALNKIDYYVFKENYFEAIQVVDQLQDQTEDDFLNYLKANIAFEDKNYSFALNLYKYTIDNYPNFFEGQAGYLSTLVLMKKYAEATNYIDTLIDEGYDRSELINYIEEDDDSGINILDPLVTSNVYKSWKTKTN